MTINIFIYDSILFLTIKYFVNAKEKYYIIITIKNEQFIAVSVIIPVFNKAILLKRSLDSIERQTFKQFEIIFVDCSNDDSSSYIMDKLKENSNIRLVQHVFNQGINMTRIHTVMNTKGQYIMSLDPNDEYNNDAIENSYNYAFIF